VAREERYITSFEAADLLICSFDRIVRGCHWRQGAGTEILDGFRHFSEGDICNPNFNAALADFIYAYDLVFEWFDN
jgi:hypothetical protein